MRVCLIGIIRFFWPKKTKHPKWSAQKISEPILRLNIKSSLLGKPFFMLIICVLGQTHAYGRN